MEMDELLAEELKHYNIEWSKTDVYNKKMVQVMSLISMPRSILDLTDENEIAEMDKKIFYKIGKTMANDIMKKRKNCIAVVQLTDIDYFYVPIAKGDKKVNLICSAYYEFIKKPKNNS